MAIEASLFDVYHFEDVIYLWLIDENRRLFLLKDEFYPEIYADGPPDLLRKLVKRIEELGALASPPSLTKRKLFYENRVAEVLKIEISRPSILRRIRSKLFAFYGKMDIYHSDLEIPMNYMYSRGLYPLARVKAEVLPFNRVHSLKTLDSITDLEYFIPPFREARFYLKYSHRIAFTRDSLGYKKSSFKSYGNILCIRFGNDSLVEISFDDPQKALYRLNELMQEQDPDIILSAYGDQAIFPQLFYLAQKYKIPLLLDRDVTPYMTRKIIRTGSSYESYGNIIYRAPSYPLFGRWHIDSSNSFVMKEARFRGVLELSRLTRFPVQRLARASTGAALTYLETRTAFEKGYLVPWQKSRLEEEKSAYELLINDKGGMIYQPSLEPSQANGPPNVYENVTQLDFSQMYPTIMVNHNLSPETVNCLCCKEGETPLVPEIGYRICTKRHGVVSGTLSSLLKRRHYYKQKMKELKRTIAALKTKDSSNDILQKEEKELAFYDSRQSSLKWMLVTSFGYLGYRNAKFGKLESHEAVTAFGRDKILTAKEIAERRGYRTLNAIVDCLFIQKDDHSPAGPDEMEALCREITMATGVQMSIDGIFSWMIFFTSVSDSKLTVANRYMGRYAEGGIKYRGIALRRKDTVEWIKDFQKEILEVLEKTSSIKEIMECRRQLENILERYREDIRRRRVLWKKLLIRKSTSKDKEDYSVENASLLMIRELESSLQSRVSAGEKVRYLVICEKHPNKRLRYLSEEKARYCSSIKYDSRYYERILWKAFEEIWGSFASPFYFEELRTGQREMFLENHE